MATVRLSRLFVNITKLVFITTFNHTSSLLGFRRKESRVDSPLSLLFTSGDIPCGRESFGSLDKAGEQQEEVARCP